MSKKLGEHLCLICRLGRDDGVDCMDIMAHAANWDV